MTTSKFIDNDALAPHFAAHISANKLRHDQALEKAGAACAVIFSGAPIPVFRDDYNYPFKANPYFLCWVPLTALPYSYIIYTPGEKPILVYFQERDYWHTPPTDPEGFWTPYFDIRVAHDLDDIAQHMPANKEKCIFLGQLSDDKYAQGITRVNPSSATNILDYARGVKTEYELECMRQASRRGVAGHRAAKAAFMDKKSELDIHLTYSQAVQQSEIRLPYGNIIALNQHGAVLHYQNQDAAPPADFKSFLIDAGAQVYMYASDITRTYSAADDEFAELITDFDRLEKELVAGVVAGVSYPDLHVLAHLKIGQFLVNHGFANGYPEDLLEQGVTAAFYPHGLGHLLGLQVHDVGGFMADAEGNVIDRPSGHPFLRLTRPLLKDMVLTVEPGVYVIDMLLENLKGTPGDKMVNYDRVDMLRPYGGIRIEDNVRVLDDSNENFTRDAFSAAE